jgi:CDP-glycerol:poly(glycerophosphate) glycerophosphotransferase
MKWIEMSRMLAKVTSINNSTLLRLGLSTLAMLAFVFTALTSWSWVGFAFAGLVLLALGAWFIVQRRASDYADVQVLMLGGFLVNYDLHPNLSLAADHSLLVTGVIVMALMLTQPLFERIVNRTTMTVANLPGAPFQANKLLNPSVLYAALTVVVALIGITVATVSKPWPVEIIAGVVVLAQIGAVGHAVVRLLREHLAPSILRDALARYQPEFALYFSAPDNTEYHIAMWLPYLERIGRPFIIILREEQAFKTISRTTKSPVIYCFAVPALDNVVVPSLRAVYYVNNGSKNAHMVRFNDLTHIQLLHGDSDKASSFNPVTAMFDRVYVAGRAAIDRYAANDVYIAPEKFVIVGRPQVEEVAVVRTPISQIGPKTVLYATTWSGIYSDANYCSLANGKKIIAALLDRDVTVILRPHPYTNRNPESKTIIAAMIQMLAADSAKTGRKHLYGTLAQQEMSLFECFNKADAMISDVSGVASDFLYSEKPLALTDMVNEGSEFATSFPLAKAAYVLGQDASNLDQVLDQLLETDPIVATRRAMKEYYLGDFPPDDYANAFVRASRDDVLTRKVVAVATRDAVATVNS